MPQTYTYASGHRPEQLKAQYSMIGPQNQDQLPKEVQAAFAIGEHITGVILLYDMPGDNGHIYRDMPKADVWLKNGAPNAPI